MSNITSDIGGVQILFKDGVNADVDPRLIEALHRVVRAGVPFLHLVRSLVISSANDSHKWPSRHVQQKAVDISRINGRFILEGYGSDPAITAIVQRMQEEFERVPGRRENFGPYLKLKHGRPHAVSGHADHMHFSID